jgi:hypothetical protein
MIFLNKGKKTEENSKEQ